MTVLAVQRAVAPLALVVALSLSSPAWAGGAPTATVQEFFAIVNRILDDPATDDKRAERVAAILAAAREVFDARGAAELALGPEWHARTFPEQEEFAALFRNLFERSFLTAFVSRSGAVDGVHVTYLGESVEDAAATVRTAVDARSGGDLTVDYRMVERDGRWLVRDVVMDGVSLTANYRAQFSRVIQASSYPELVAQIRARTEDVSPAVASAEPHVHVAPGPARDESVRTSPAAVEPVRPDRVAQPASSPSRPVDAPRQSLTSVRADQPAKQGPRRTARAGHAVSRHRTYWVQVGAFKTSAAAHRFKDSLTQHDATDDAGWQIVVDPATSRRSLTRVRIGPFRDRARAASRVRELKARGYESFVVAAP